MIFLALAIILAQFAALAMKNGTSDAVAALAAVELSQRGSALGFVVDIGKSMQRFIDATKLYDSLRQPGRPVANLEGVASENGLQSTLSRLEGSERPIFPGRNAGTAAPDVISGQIDMLPAERGQVFEKRFVDAGAILV